MLSTHPNDIVKYEIKEVDFSDARFNESDNGSEKFIVSGTGNLLITWSMKNILKGKIFAYEVFLYEIRSKE